MSDNIVTLPIKFRKREDVAKIQKKDCKHQYVTCDPIEKIVFCNDCKSSLDPWWLLYDLSPKNSDRIKLLVKGMEVNTKE